MTDTIRIRRAARVSVVPMMDWIGGVNYKSYFNVLWLSALRRHT